MQLISIDVVMKDMVAFSCCIYDGGEEEKHEMDIVRERSWRGKFRRRGRVIRPGANRVDGKCPLTPLEVPLLPFWLYYENTVLERLKCSHEESAFSQSTVLEYELCF